MSIRPDNGGGRVGPHTDIDFDAIGGAADKSGDDGRQVTADADVRLPAAYGQTLQAEGGIGASLLQAQMNKEFASLGGAESAIDALRSRISDMEWAGEHFHEFDAETDVQVTALKEAILDRFADVKRGLDALPGVSDGGERSSETQLAVDEYNQAVASSMLHAAISREGIDEAIPLTTLREARELVLGPLAGHVSLESYAEDQSKNLIERAMHARFRGQ